MEIYVDGKKKQVKSCLLSKIMEELDINPEEFLVVRGKELVTFDTRIGEGDRLELLQIVSGG